MRQKSDVIRAAVADAERRVADALRTGGCTGTARVELATLQAELEQQLARERADAEAAAHDERVERDADIRARTGLILAESTARRRAILERFEIEGSDERVEH